MILALLLYGIVIASLLASAATFFDQALRARRRPTRWVWLLALVAGFLAPFVSRLLPLPAPASAPTTSHDSWPELYDLGAGLQPAVSELGWSMSLLDRPIVVLWLLASVGIAVLLSWTVLRIRRERRRWETRTVAGEEVLVSPALGPAVMGILRPRIVLPRWTLSLGEPGLALVLQHEREHRRTRDPALLAGGTLVAMACPLNPALWWMLRRLRLAVEADCDARVLDGGAGRTEYGHLLLEVASRSRVGFPLTPALVERRGTLLERRLEMIRSDGKKTRWPSTIFATCAGAFFVALACETPLPPSSMDTESESTPRLESEAEVPDPARETQDVPSALVRGFPTEISGRPQISGRPLIFVDGVPGRPLVFVDGVPREDGIDPATGLDARDIDRIEVIKGDAAVGTYGPEASAGVIQIFTKRGGEKEGEEAAPEIREQEEVPLIPDSTLQAGARREAPPTLPRVLVRPPEGERASPAEAAGSGKPLVIIDGVVAGSSDWREAVDATDIEKIEVIKGGAAEALYGPKGANGVILITLKKK